MRRRVILILLFTGLLSVFGVYPTKQYAEAEQSSTVEVTLHKRLYRDIRAEEYQTYQNDGLEMNAGHQLLENTQGMNGAHFEVYEVTEYVYTHAKEPEALMKEFNQMTCRQARKLAKEHAFNYVTTIRTDTDAVTQESGVASIQLSGNIREGRGAYLFIETAVDEETTVNVDLEREAIPMLLILPVVHPVESHQLKTVHLYPKNVGYYRDPYFFKYGKKSDGSEEPIAGAVFALYRMTEEKEKRYLSANKVSNLENHWVASADPLNDEAVSKFTSDEQGLVKSSNEFLSSGTYYFEELRAAAGYLIHEAAKEIKIEVPESWTDSEGNELPVMIDGQPLEELLSGEVPESAYKAARPRIYNMEKEPVKKPGGTLLKAGEIQSLVSLSGLCLIGGVLFAIGKRRTKLNK